MIVSKTFANHHFLKRLILLAVVWVAAYGGSYLVLKFLGIVEQDFSHLIINIVFLLTCIGCIHQFRLSSEDVGLNITRSRLTLHLGLCLAIFTMYWLYYLVVVKISSHRPFSTTTLWGLLNYLVVAIAEEIYYRGLFYHVVEERTSGKFAVLISGLLFGLVHFRQGLGMLPRFFTGWLWGSVRFTTGMVFMLIPLHFNYNAVWLLFNGNWDSRSIFVILFPLVELLLAFLIIVFSRTPDTQTERS